MYWIYCFCFSGEAYQFRGPAAGKLNSMQIRCKYGQLGPGKGQFNSPHGFCLGSEEDIIVADTNNHRIQVFDKAGSFKFQFGTAGNFDVTLFINTFFDLSFKDSHRQH